MPAVKALKQSKTFVARFNVPADPVEASVRRLRKGYLQNATCDNSSRGPAVEEATGMADLLTGEVYAELFLIGRKHMSRERRNVDFEADDLVHEACIRLLRQENPWSSRAQFCKAASRVMVEVLIDWARRRNTLKRGRDWQRVDLEDLSLLKTEGGSEPVPIRRALAALKEVSPRKYQVLVLRGLHGLSIAETAKKLGVGLSTVKSDWAEGGAWVRNALS